MDEKRGILNPPLWLFSIILGSVVLLRYVMDPMQSRGEAIGPGRVMLQHSWLLKDAFRTCVQPEVAADLWPEGFSRMYCAVDWSGVGVTQILYFPFAILFGNNRYTIRCVAVGFTIISSYLLGRMVKNVWGGYWGHLTIAMYLCCPLVAFYSWYLHGILITAGLIPLWIHAVMNGVEYNRWKWAYILLVFLSIGTKFFSVAVIVVCASLFLMMSEERMNIQRHLLGFVLITVFLNYLNMVFAAEIMYGGLRGTGQSMGTWVTTFDFVSDPNTWDEFALNFKQFGWMLSIGVMGLMVISFRHSTFSTSQQKTISLHSDGGRLFLSCLATASMGVSCTILFAGAVADHLFYLVTIAPSLAVTTVYLFKQININQVRLALIGLTSIVMVLNVDATYDLEGKSRDFEPVWINWMEDNVEADDVVLIHQSLVNSGNGATLHAMGDAEFRLMEVEVNQEIVLNHVDADEDVTMIIVPYQDIEITGTLRHGLIERGWEREALTQYMGGYTTWIVFHRV